MPRWKVSYTRRRFVYEQVVEAETKKDALREVEKTLGGDTWRIINAEKQDDAKL
jgi:hypothetical protein